MNAVTIIDQARADHAAGRIDRQAAIERIRATGLQLTLVGICDLLDHEKSAAQRYAEVSQ